MLKTPHTKDKSVWVFKVFLLLLMITCLTVPNVFPVVGRDACVVRGSLPGQRKERCHYGQPVRHRDSEGDWYQQPFAQAQTPPRHPGNGLPHQSICTCQHPLRKAQSKQRSRNGMCRHIVKSVLFVLCNYSQPATFG